MQCAAFRKRLPQTDLDYHFAIKITFGLPTIRTLSDQNTSKGLFYWRFAGFSAIAVICQRRADRQVDLGDPNRFKTLGELVAEIYRTVWDYNNTRIHSELNMPPVAFAKRYPLVA